MKTIYKKHRIRQGLILRQQVCYQAERNLFPKICNNQTFFEPLFIHKSGKGASIHYDYTDIDQDPVFAAKYIRDNPDHFWKIVREYHTQIGILTELVKTSKNINFSEVYNLLIEFWARMTLFILLADGWKNFVSAEISSASYKLRAEHDKLIYEVMDRLLEHAKNLVPEEYQEFVDFLLFEEITSGKLPSIERLEKRKEGYIYFRGNLYVDENLTEFLEKNNLSIVSDLDKEVEQIKGFGASKGSVKGKVRVIMNAKEITNLQKGEILVTPMTTPDFILRLENAVAIITDEGGITCHAAIVAREFKIPAVIGTDHATEILKDGDEVHVNGEEGIVKIISKESRVQNN